MAAKAFSIGAATAKGPPPPPYGQRNATAAAASDDATAAAADTAAQRRSLLRSLSHGTSPSSTLSRTSFLLGSSSPSGCGAGAALPPRPPGTSSAPDRSASSSSAAAGSAPGSLPPYLSSGFSSYPQLGPEYQKILALHPGPILTGAVRLPTPPNKAAPVTTPKSTRSLSLWRRAGERGGSHRSGTGF